MKSEDWGVTFERVVAVATTVTTVATVTSERVVATGPRFQQRPLLRSSRALRWKNGEGLAS